MGPRLHGLPVGKKCLVLLFAVLSASTSTRGGRIGGLPDIDYAAHFHSADTDSTRALDSLEFESLARDVFRKHSSHSFNEVAKLMAARTFELCDADAGQRVDLAELLRCTDHHYLYTSWVAQQQQQQQQGHASLWPPALRRVERFAAFGENASGEVKRGLQHFWRHGFSVFRVLDDAEAEQVKVIDAD